MKKRALMIFASVFALTGCASVEAEKEIAKTPTEATVLTDIPQAPAAGLDSEAMGNMLTTDGIKVAAANGSENATLPLEYETLTKPPALTVSMPECTDSVIASCGNYHWSHALPDGTAADLVACGAHPLDWQEHPILYTAFPVKGLSSPKDGGRIDSMVPEVHLDFGGFSPDTLSAIRWPASYVGDAQNHSEDYEAVTAKADGGIIFLLPLEDGDYIYEISATWGNVGGASYTFRTLPQMQGVQEDKQARIFDALNRLEYQPYTCDGLPEYRLTAADGTVYSINLSEKWAWRGNKEQAELSDELIAQLREGTASNED